MEARASLLASGIGRDLVNDIVGRVAGLGLRHEAMALTSDPAPATRLAHWRRRSRSSPSASTSPPRRRPRRASISLADVVVANADRRLPLLDASVDLVMSLHGRRNPAECARVLTASGSLLVALPAPDDLIASCAGWFRERVTKWTAARRCSRSISHCSPWPTDGHPRHADARARAAAACASSTYRGARLTLADRVNALESMEVTFSSNVFVMKRAG